jgi:hypothetical protein
VSLSTRITGGLGGFFASLGRITWAPTLTSHDPNPPFPIETGAVGPTGLKTVLGLPKASIKTILGLALASTKTWNGLA